MCCIFLLPVSYWLIHIGSVFYGPESRQAKGGRKKFWESTNGKMCFCLLYFVYIVYFVTAHCFTFSTTFASRNIYCIPKISYQKLTASFQRLPTVFYTYMVYNTHLLVKIYNNRHLWAYSKNPLCAMPWYRKTLNVRGLDAASMYNALMQKHPHWTAPWCRKTTV